MDIGKRVREKSSRLHIPPAFGSSSEFGPNSLTRFRLDRWKTPGWESKVRIGVSDVPRSGRFSGQKLTRQKLLQFINSDSERTGIIDNDVGGLAFGFQIQ